MGYRYHSLSSSSCCYVDTKSIVVLYRKQLIREMTKAFKEGGFPAIRERVHKMQKGQEHENEPPKQDPQKRRER